MQWLCQMVAELRMNVRVFMKNIMTNEPHKEKRKNTKKLDSSLIFNNLMIYILLILYKELIYIFIFIVEPVFYTLSIFLCHIWSIITIPTWMIGNNKDWTIVNSW